jgi:hypothetical protein
LTALTTVSSNSGLIIQKDAAHVSLALGFYSPDTFQADVFANRGYSAPLINLSLPIPGSLTNYLPLSEERDGIFYWLPSNISLPSFDGPSITILMDSGDGLEELWGPSFRGILAHYPHVATNGTIILVVDDDFSDQFNFSGLQSLQIFVISIIQYPLEIPASTFQGLGQLVAVSIHAAVSVGESAFSGCSFLKTAELDNVEIIH